jgi:hypothetical protein
VSAVAAPTIEWPAGDRLALGFHALNAADAVTQAKAWARSEGLHVRTLCSVRPVPESHDTWRVVLSIDPKAAQ